MKSKIAVIFLSSIFPIVINTASGMRVLDANLVKAAKAFGATPWQLFLTIGLPSSVPFVLAGLRLAVGRAGQTFETDTFFVAVIIVVVAGVTLTEGLKWLESRFAAWRPQTE